MSTRSATRGCSVRAASGDAPSSSPSARPRACRKPAGEGSRSRPSSRAVRSPASSAARAYWPAASSCPPRPARGRAAPRTAARPPGRPPGTDPAPPLARRSARAGRPRADRPRDPFVRSPGPVSPSPPPVADYPVAAALGVPSSPSPTRTNGPILHPPLRVLTPRRLACLAPEPPPAQRLVGLLVPHSPSRPTAPGNANRTPRTVPRRGRPGRRTHARRGTHPAAASSPGVFPPALGARGRPVPRLSRMISRPARAKQHAPPGSRFRGKR